MTDVNLLSLFKPLADIILANEEILTTEKDRLRDDSKAESILEAHKDTFCRMNPISWQQFQQIIFHNSKRFDSLAHEKNISRYQDVVNVINALCHPKTVRSACDLYLQQIRDSGQKWKKQHNKSEKNEIPAIDIYSFLPFRPLEWTLLILGSSQFCSDQSICK